MSLEHIYKVSDLNREIKQFIDYEEKFKDIFVEGEMSNITYYKSGHLYFNIKDKTSQMKCVAFNYKLKSIPENLKEGDMVKIFADISFYEARGEIQILVRHIEKQNALGEMFAKLEKLKKRMEMEGYFLEQHKKKLPSYPNTIGVVTAATGAALFDIINTVKKRNSKINIIVYPAKVQGVGSKEEIIKGIETLNKVPEIDLIIAGRGGGSIEDLWAFNEEEVALAFFNSKKPIISAVGHEIDNLLTDLTADVRAATPTQAIEIAIPKVDIMEENLNSRKKSLNSILLNKIEKCRYDINRCKNSYVISNFLKSINNLRQQTIDKEQYFFKVLKNVFEEKKKQLETRINKIIVLSPINTLKRGYSIVTKDSKSITQANELSINDEILIKLSEGQIIGIVKEKLDEKNLD